MTLLAFLSSCAHLTLAQVYVPALDAVLPTIPINKPSVSAGCIKTTVRRVVSARCPTRLRRTTRPPVCISKMADARTMTVGLPTYALIRRHRIVMHSDAWVTARRGTHVPISMRMNVLPSPIPVFVFLVMIAVWGTFIAPLE